LDLIATAEIVNCTV